MQKSFQTLLQSLHCLPSFHTANHFQRCLTDEDIEELKSGGVIKQGSDLREVPCEGCMEPHFTSVWEENAKILTVCPAVDHNPRVLDSSEVQTWSFDVETFLRQMALKLGVKDQIEALVVDGMWQVGTFTQDDTHHTCYFFCGKDFREVVEFIKKQPADFRRYVVVTCKQESAEEVEQELLLIEAEQLVDLKAGIQFSKKTFEKHLISGFRGVYFDEKNGDLSVNGQLVVNLTPSTPEFHFAQALWGNFNTPQSHRSLVSHIYKKTRQEYADTESKTCHKMKRSIKKEAKNAKMLDQILQSTKNEQGENSYIMRNPA